MGIFEYDEEKHMQQIREEGQQEGRLSKLAEQISHLRERGLSVEDIADILVESPEQIRQIMDTLA